MFQLDLFEWKPPVSKKYVLSDGTIQWRNSKGERHRVGGPAIEWANGTKEWWLNGKRHRINGPAVECADGNKHWYLNGKYLTEKEWKQAVKKL